MYVIWKVNSSVGNSLVVVLNTAHTRIYVVVNFWKKSHSFPDVFFQFEFQRELEPRARLHSFMYVRVDIFFPMQIHFIVCLPSFTITSLRWSTTLENRTAYVLYDIHTLDILCTRLFVVQKTWFVSDLPLRGKGRINNPCFEGCSSLK